MNIHATITPLLLVGYFSGLFLYLSIRYFINYFSTKPDPTVKTRFFYTPPPFFPNHFGWWLFATFMIFLAITGIRQTYFS
jgi:hypothetical protein